MLPLSAMEIGGLIFLHGAPAPVDGVPPSIEWPRNLVLVGTVNMDETTHAVSDKVRDRAFTLEMHEADLDRMFESLPASDRAHDVEGVLQGLYDALRPARRHFGYRTAREILAFLRQAPEYEEYGIDRKQLLDQAVFSRVLPRLRGEDNPALQKSLQTAKKLCAKKDLPRCAEKLEEMLELLSRHGVTRF